MSENESGVSGLGWFLAGLGIGALVGVLYAPKSGKETRDELASSARDAREKAMGYVDQSKEQLGQYVERGKEYYEKGRTQWSDYVEKGKSFVQDQQSRVATAVDAGKQAFTQAQQSAQQGMEGANQSQS